MKRIALALLLVCAAGVALAQSPEPAVKANPSDSEKLTALSSDIRSLARVTELSTKLEDNRQVLNAITDAEIEALREPRPDGTYVFASLTRDEAKRVTESGSVERVSTEEQLDSVTVSSPRAYRLVVTVPKKRNMVSANVRVFVKNAVVDWTSFDGKTHRDEIAVDTWVNPGDSTGVALPDIARSAKATVRLGVDSGKKKAEAQVALLQAKLVDDPASPYFPAVSRLLNLQRLLGEEKLRKGDIKSAIDEALLALPGELDKRMAERAAAQAAREQLAASGTLKGTVAVGDATPDVVAELAAIFRLGAGTLEEQTEARNRLQHLIEQLTPKLVPGT